VFLRQLLTTSRVGQLAPKEIPVLRGEQTIADAVREMRSHSHGCAMVCRDGKLIGIFTERDLMKLLAAGKTLEQPLSAVMTAKQATSRIPIVFAAGGDPIGNGIVASLARPGGNLTGLSAQSYDIWPKQLDLARELVPNLKRVSFLFDTSEEPHALTYANEFSELARSTGMTVRTLPIASLADLRSALRTVHKERPQLLIIWTSDTGTAHTASLVSVRENPTEATSLG
jgi:hypothetical protein